VAVPPQSHQGRIDGNTGKPRRKPGIAFETLEMNKGPLKRLLRYVFCILVVPHYSAGQAKNHRFGLFAKDLERSRISTLCGGKKHVFISRNRVSACRPSRLFPVEWH
jgi:hypothetical protein